RPRQTRVERAEGSVRGALNGPTRVEVRTVGADDEGGDAGGIVEEILDRCERGAVHLIEIVEEDDRGAALLLGRAGEGVAQRAGEAVLAIHGGSRVARLWSAEDFNQTS